MSGGAARYYYRYSLESLRTTLVELGALAAWDFDAGSGTTVDDWRNAAATYDLAITGAAWGAGCLDFDGVNDALTLTQNANINGMTEATLWLVATFDTISTADRLWQKSGNGLDIFLNATGAVSATVFYSTTNANMISVPVLQTGRVHSIAVRWSDADKTVRVNVDGLAVAASSLTVGVGARQSSTSDLILMNRAGFDRAADGCIYHAALFDAALSDVQLAKLAGVV